MASGGIRRRLERGAPALRFVPVVFERPEAPKGILDAGPRLCPVFGALAGFFTGMADVVFRI